jgi:hypothetical protein
MQWIACINVRCFIAARTLKRHVDIIARLLIAIDHRTFEGSIRQPILPVAQKLEAVDESLAFKRLCQIEQAASNVAQRSLAGNDDAGVTLALLQPRLVQSSEMTDVEGDKGPSFCRRPR